MSNGWFEESPLGQKGRWMMDQEESPNCYKCTHRRNLPGDCYSRCSHPAAGSSEAKDKLRIVGAEHGIKHGWFSWPSNFDPVWLRRCSGFESREVRSA